VVTVRKEEGALDASASDVAMAIRAFQSEARNGKADACIAVMDVGRSCRGRPNEASRSWQQVFRDGRGVAPSRVASP